MDDDRDDSRNQLKLLELSGRLATDAGNDDTCRAG